MSRRRSDDVRGEELHIRTANDRALEEMRERMDRELENAKLELLEVKLYHVSLVFDTVQPLCVEMS